MLPPLGRALLGELVGTFILVFFGCGAVHSAVLTGNLTGLWQIGVVWGLGVIFAAYTVGAVSGAHINPAMTVALAAWGRFTWSRVLPYVFAQTVGALIAAAALFGIYRHYIDEIEGSAAARTTKTAKCYGEYFGLDGNVTLVQACGAEVLGTALLAFVVFATTDERNRGRPAERFAPVFVGLTVTAIICVIAPLTQACLNPARDFGPRLFAYFAGWRDVAIPGPNGHGFYLVYIVAPIVGGLLGAAVYELLFREGENATKFEKGT
jgi:glycerol uptake facilitator protein